MGAVVGSRGFGESRVRSRVSGGFVGNVLRKKIVIRGYVASVGRCYVRGCGRLRGGLRGLRRSES